MLVAIAVLCFSFIALNSTYRLIKAKNRLQMELMDESFATDILPDDEGYMPTQAELDDAAISNTNHAWSDFWYIEDAE